MKNNTNFSEALFQFRYTMESFDGCEGPEKYLNHYALEIWQGDEEGRPTILAGKGDLYNIRIEAALNGDEEILDLFDYQASLLDLGNAIFDFKEEKLKKDVMNFCSHKIYIPNIFFINRLELLPQFRGHGLGKKVVRDICHRFACTSELFVSKAFPLQFESKVIQCPESWDEQMEFQRLEQDEEKATYKLYSYYQSLDFSNILKNDFFFLRND